MRSILLLVLLSLFINSYSQRACLSTEYQQSLVKEDPSLIERFAMIEKTVQAQLHNRNPLSTAYGSIQLSPRVITIPVVVHVLYNAEQHNISKEQIESQIEALNRDFRRKNADTLKTPEVFRHFAADCLIEFKLATVDPTGKPTNGIVRRKTSIQLYGLDDRIKQSGIGGSDPWDTKRYLNIWVGQLAGGLIGYASPLGGPANRDGVVIRTNAFGTKGLVSAPYHLGRTATHEIGHWLGLQHIWGDAHCGDDKVEDTPPQQSASRGCPSGTITSCGNNGNMYMNYMDFTNDACLNMFTAGQRERMLASFKPGGPRHSLLSSNGATGEPVAYEEEPQAVKEESIQVQLYPNPVGSRLFVEIKGSLRYSELPVLVYTQSGQLVKKVVMLQESASLDLSDLRPGMYFLRLEGIKRTFTVIKK